MFYRSQRFRVRTTPCVFTATLLSVLTLIPANAGLAFPQTTAPEAQASAAPAKAPDKAPVPSLGDLARRLKAQHGQEAQKPGKVYTNDDLPAATSGHSAVTESAPPAAGGTAQKEKEASDPTAASSPPVKEPESAPAGDLSPLTIPRGVRYKRADAATLSQAAELVKRVLAPGYSGRDHILNKMVLCGPFIWPQLSAQGQFGKNDAFTMDMSVNLGGQKTILHGEGLRDPVELFALEAHLRSALLNDGGFFLRAADPQELKLYWAIIAWDIEEPLFILQTPSHKILMEIHDGSVFYLDDFQGVRLSPPGQAAP
jgi:hypothetical protein